MDEALYALQQADLFVAVGTSAQVQPAAAFVHWAAEQGARTMEINLASTLSTEDFDESRQGRAGDLVPVWVEELVADR